ncbi:MAG: tRNA guanosine(34) transglycosylase Tgt [bacterium]
MINKARLHTFEIVAKDSKSQARRGLLRTAHGPLETPCFFPVGTAGTVKTLSPDELLGAGVQGILANSYHLYLRPGLEVLRAAGGLHRFMNWHRPILTDSGGYQVFSLANLKRVEDEGVLFQSHIDGSYHFLTPAKVIEIQRAIGSDLMMPLDLCAPYPTTYAQAKEWHEQTLLWAAEAQHEHEKQPFLYGHPQELWGIVQGSTFEDLRRESIERLSEMDFPGYAIGGLAVGEPRAVFLEMVELCAELLPGEKPRYLMGVGTPADLLDAVALGMDFFECVLPTRVGRGGSAFTWKGRLSVKAAHEKEAFTPMDSDCSCYACRNFTRAYLRHLFVAEESLALRLVSLHNVHFYQELMARMRQKIADGTFSHWKSEIQETLREAESGEQVANDAAE